MDIVRCIFKMFMPHICSEIWQHRKKVNTFIYPFLKYLVIVSEGVGSLGWIKVRVDFNWYLFAGWYSVLLYVLLKRKNEGKNMAFV